MRIDGTHYRTVWFEGGRLHLIDQPLLPHRFEIARYSDYREAARAIRTMVVRGAPAIGVTAAYGVVLSARHHQQQDAGNWRAGFDADMQMLAQARPTAVNLGWAISHMQQLI